MRLFLALVLLAGSAFAQPVQRVCTRVDNGNDDSYSVSCPAGTKIVRLVATTPNTDGAELSIDGGATSAAVKHGGSADPASNTIPGSGKYVDLVFDGTYWQIIGAASGGGSGVVYSDPRSYPSYIDFGSIADGTCSDSTYTAAGMTAGKPLAVSQPAGFNAGLSVMGIASATDTVKLRVCNLSGGAVDPAAATFSVRDMSNYGYSEGSSAIQFPEIVDGGYATRTFTLTGAVVGDNLAPLWPAGLESGLNGWMYVTDTDTVTIILYNLSGASITPASATFGAAVGGGAGSGGSILSVFGRSGAILAVSGDYNAGQITNTPAGDVGSVTVQAAINELDSEKAANGHNHDAAYAGITHASRHQNGGADEIATATPAANVIPKAGADGKLAAGFLPAPAVATLGGVKRNTGSGCVSGIDTDGTLLYAACAGGSDDQTATEVPVTPAGNIAATNTQAALEELDSEKAASGHNHSGTYEPANANIQSHISSTSNPHTVTATQVGLGSVPNYAAASQAEAEAGTAADKLMTPQRVAQALLTLPVKKVSSGTSLPGTCTASELFFLTTGNSGLRLAVCDSNNTWLYLPAVSATGTTVVTFLAGTAPGAPTNAGEKNFYFSSVDGFPYYHANGAGSPVAFYTSANPQPTADNSVTYAKIQQVSTTDRILGRVSAGAGNVEEITFTDAMQALADDADAAAQRTTLGLGAMATGAYPGSGVVTSNGSGWGTSYTVGTEANNLVQLNASAQLPAVSGALLTNLPAPPSLSANGGNCSSGQFPLGVDASGAVEGCSTVDSAVSAASTTVAGKVELATTAETTTGTDTERAVTPAGLKGSNHNKRAFTTKIWGTGTGNLLQDTDDEVAIFYNSLGQGITITDVSCKADTATATTIQLQKDDGSPTNMLSSSLSCTSTRGNTTSFVSGENQMASATGLDFVTVSAGGANHWVSITVTYTLD